MVKATILSICIALLLTLIIARLLYRFSFSRGLLRTKKDYIINASIIGFVFFCSSSILYVCILNV